MNPRERYIAAATFKPVDKVPLLPGGPRESTLERWHKEGLPEKANYLEYIFKHLGIKKEKTKPHISPGVNFKMIPWFEEKIIEHKDGHYIVQDWMGAITEISDKYDYTYIRNAKDFVTRKWHKFPVENRADFEKMKIRYDAKSKERFPSDFEERCKKLNERDYVSTIAITGPFWQLREWCGFEGLCILFKDNPNFVREMTTFWGKFVYDVLNILLESYCPDQVIINEDMAYKAHSMISPKMAKEFLVPVYNIWIPLLKQKGCPLITMDSDGFIGELIPLWVEAGFNGCVPMEVAAGNDIVEYRNTYGTKMAYYGGIDKRAIAAGGKTIEKEVKRTVPPLIKTGGYIPGCDHGVPHDISFKNFIKYTEILAKLTGWL